MRTKALLLSAAIGAISLATSFAQVYSVNVVGYVNVPVVNGFNCVANPLDATPNNNINSVIPSTSDGTQILKWLGTGFSVPHTYYDGYGWADPDLVLSTYTVAPGEGFFLNMPGPTNVTFVGEVRQGSLSNYLATGFNLISQLTPQSGDLMSFEFPARDGDQILYWLPSQAPQGYSIPITFYEGYGWADPDLVLVTPNVNVGQGFFVNKFTAAPWTHVFNVNTP